MLSWTSINTFTVDGDANAQQNEHIIFVTDKSDFSVISKIWQDDRRMSACKLGEKNTLIT